MRTRTLHSIEQWHWIKNPDAYQQYADSDASPERNAWEAQYAILRPYITDAKSKSRQGVLLEIIQSDAPDNVIILAIALYRGFRRGFRTLEQIIERENARIIRLCPPHLEGDPVAWREINESRICGLIELFGWMRTDKAHEYLMRLAQPEYHPFIQSEAVNAMAFEGDKFDAKFVLSLLLDSKTPERKLWHALYAAMYNNRFYSVGQYCRAIWPYVEHPSPLIYQEAIAALAYKGAGRRRLHQLAQLHKNDPATDPKLLLCIEREVSGYDVDDHWDYG